MIVTETTNNRVTTEARTELPHLEAWSAVTPCGRRTPMQHQIWVRACYEVLYRRDGPVVIDVEDGVGAFARKGLAPPTLFLVGAEEIAEPIEVVTGSRMGAEELSDRLIATGLPIRFGHHPSDTVFSEVFAERAARKGRLLRLPVPGSPYITLDDSWKEPTERFNSRRRSDFRRMRRRAEVEGEVTFEFHEPSPAEVAPLLETAIDVESRSWKSRSGTALVDNAQQREFFLAYGRLASSEGIFRVNFMKIGDETVAMQIAAECDDGYWLFKIGYDEQYSRCSPGMLMMLESIRHAANRGLSTFEFLGKSADWTKFWTEAERPNCSMRYYPRNPYGYLALGRDAAAIGSRRAAKKIRAMLDKRRKATS